MSLNGVFAVYGLLLLVLLLLEQRTALPFEVLYLCQQILDRYVKVSGEAVHTEILCQFSAVELLIQPDCVFV